MNALDKVHPIIPWEEWEMKRPKKFRSFMFQLFKNVTLTNLCTALRLAEINEEETPEYVYWLYRIIDAEELPDEEEK